ncbi:MAG: hypothetical protein QOK37_1877 [Thermoanaerobaculia bacterium]|jgi:hypothetical protein|nr:hypothetical protein [Thermoanaerobaculia bacterium]
MRAFHFLNAKYGLEDIRERRLKIATLAELNDPFEFFGAYLGDPDDRRKLRQVRESAGERLGLLCFSRRWDNPVLWSHYAEKHTGLCLGFEIAEEVIAPVMYAKRRFKLQPDPLKATGAPDEESVKKLMFTKYSHWRYESELRTFGRLDQRDSDTGLFFATFNEHMRLASVIVGALSMVSRDDVTNALGDLASEVEVIKARLAFRSFRVVRQQGRRPW